MTPEEIYLRWAPESSPWSPWVIPVPFAQIDVQSLTLQNEPITNFELGSLAELVRNDTAFVIDLPGAQAVPCGLALAPLGVRPVPVIDGSPGPTQSVVDMTLVLRGFRTGAQVLAGIGFPTDAPPAFLLDAMRTRGHRFPTENLFDNRWKTFPQDYPSARFMDEHGIRRVILVQARADQPQEDLAHVLLRWQEAGIRLEVYGTEEGGRLQELSVDRPSHFRALWHRALAMLGLKRGAFGGFGGWPHGTGGG